LNQKANITFDALSQNDVFEGEVYEIDPASTVVQDVVYYKIKLRLKNIDQRQRVKKFIYSEYRIL